MGFEPTTSSLGSWQSKPLLHNSLPKRHLRNRHWRFTGGSTLHNRRILECNGRTYHQDDRRKYQADDRQSLSTAHDAHRA